MTIKDFLFSSLAIASMLALGSCSNSASNATTTTEESAPAEETVVETTDADEHVIALSEDKVISPADKPVIIDFSATWCGPCQQFKPIYHEVAAQQADNYIFYTVDIDDCKAIAEEFEIQSIPQVWALMPDGRKIQLTIGFSDKAEFEAALQKAK